jgi:predicted nuclease of predicted toxin-antitoxin system
MEFLANENFPYPSIKVLRDNGYKVKSITEDSSGISDEKVLEKAVSEGLIILTFDRDYGELIFRYRKEGPPAIIYFRSKGQSPQEAGNKLLEVISTIAIFPFR